MNRAQQKFGEPSAFIKGKPESRVFDPDDKVKVLQVDDAYRVRRWNETREQA